MLESSLKAVKLIKMLEAKHFEIKMVEFDDEYIEIRGNYDVVWFVYIYNIGKKELQLHCTGSILDTRKMEL